MRCYLAVSLAVVVIGLSGCGSKPVATQPTGQVTGTVLVNGSPLAYGQIEFGPADGPERPQRAFIKGGQYTIDVSSGKKRVVIWGITEEAHSRIPKVDAGARSKEVEASAVMKENYLPSMYNRESTLTAEVSKDGPNVCNFDLTFN
jgi:hypothetical protein